MIPVAVHRVGAAAVDIDRLAQDLAALDPAAIEVLVALEVARAVRERRLDDAIRWQRARRRALRSHSASTEACRE